TVHSGSVWTRPEAATAAPRPQLGRNLASDVLEVGLQHLHQICLVAGHVVLNGALEPVRTEVERRPAGPLFGTQDLEDGRIVDAARAQALVEIDAGVLFRAGGGAVP